MKKVREKLNAKLRKSGGFTLVEMLIVVAIIAILIAVSIPLVNSALERAREATDAANERSAAALAEIKWLSSQEAKAGDDDYINWGTETSKDFIYQIDGSTGKLIDGTAPTTGVDYGKCSEHSGGYITVTISKDDGTATIEWSEGTGNHGGYKTTP